MPDLEKQVAVVTGASSGIGRAIAASLAAQGVSLCLVGRDSNRLDAEAKTMDCRAGLIRSYSADLSLDEDIHRLVADIRKDFSQIHILIHSAGEYSMGPVRTAPVEELDRQYRVNLRAPYLLTQLLLPIIKPRGGQIVFINSTAGLSARSKVGQYAATKHGLKAFADSLREEVNHEGIRVLSIYPGRTATPMQEAVHRMEGRDYRAGHLMQPQDVAEAVMNTLAMPGNAEITDIILRPLTKSE